MKLGIIAGNRHLPLLLAQRIREEDSQTETVAFCFKKETSPSIRRLVTRTHWLHVGQLDELASLLNKENIGQCLMAGQISPIRIFGRQKWDCTMRALIEDSQDFRPHEIFRKIIGFLQQRGTVFLDLTAYLARDLADAGVAKGLTLSESLKKDIDLGMRVVSRYVELDVGQTIVVKQGAIVALESFEGTDSAIRRGRRFAGKGITVFKFSKQNQDVRFDVPVVGLGTLNLLRRVRAAALVLEQGKVIILQKDRFLEAAARWGIPVVGLPHAGNS